MTRDDGRDDANDVDTDDDEGQIVVIPDEDGNETAYEILAIVKVDEADYALLTPMLDDEPDPEQGIDVHIFRVSQDAEGNEIFDAELDEATFARVQAAAEALFDGDE